MVLKFLKYWGMFLKIAKKTAFKIRNYTVMKQNNKTQGPDWAR